MRHMGPVLLTLLALAAGAAAQPPGGGFGPPGGPANRPGFSPYLTLARGGVSPAVNYFGIVRPLQQQQQALTTLQQATSLPNPFAPAAAGDAPAVTGNPFGFQNHRLYFQNQFAGGGFGTVGGGTAGRPAAGPPGAIGSPTAGSARPSPQGRRR